MPRTCLTPDDLAAEEMESLDIRTAEGRRRAAQLHREGLRRAEVHHRINFSLEVRGPGLFAPNGFIPVLNR